jgi:anti-sigma factor RsiW
MTCQNAAPLLSEYLDGTLADDVRGAVAAHLDTCHVCRSLLADLDHIRAGARALGPITPPAHLWMEIAGRMRLDHAVGETPHVQPPAVVRTETRQWLGLAAALLLVTTAVYVMSRPDAGPAAPASVTTQSNATTPPTVETIGDTLQRAQAEYERAIAQLEEMVRSGDASVSAAAMETLQRNVITIDSAIAESRAALTDNPASQPARTSLFEALGNKVHLLQQTVVLMNEMRQGDAGGAAEAAAGIKTKTS